MQVGWHHIRVNIGSADGLMFEAMLTSHRRWPVCWLLIAGDLYVDFSSQVTCMLTSHRRWPVAKQFHNKLVNLSRSAFFGNDKHVKINTTILPRLSLISQTSKNSAVSWLSHVIVYKWYFRCQAIIWNNAGLLLIEPLGTNFSEISIGIQTFSFMKMHMKMSSAK